ncbi:MAG: CcmD family protein [Actinomycetota bacterium]|nr:CcmD family protein [Actinomycetota bacterium]MDI6821296.1 CcmD family protein [Actinomycetota bacterium]
MRYLIAAYFAVWIVLFLYVLTIERRLAHLSRELKLLREVAEKKK